jgi:hypothetical protein
MPRDAKESASPRFVAFVLNDDGRNSRVAKMLADERTQPVEFARIALEAAAQANAAYLRRKCHCQVCERAHRIAEAMLDAAHDLAKEAGVTFEAKEGGHVRPH